MSRLEDTLIRTLTEQKNPHAYTHEVKAMALEILERRTAEAAAAKAALAAALQANAATAQPWSGHPGIPYP
ncbi:MAG: hypothetical protein ACREHV_14405 [Rhizomicrobium sp.]